MTHYSIEIIQVSCKEKIWGVSSLYSVPLYYSPSFSRTLKITYVKDKYVAFLSKSTNLMSGNGQKQDPICAFVYKLDAASQGGQVFYGLKKSDLVTETNISYLKILDLLLLEGDTSSLYVLGESRFERPGADRLNNQFVLYHFELQSFGLQYQPDGVAFQESLELEVQDIKGESFHVKMSLNLFKNAKV